MECAFGPAGEGRSSRPIVERWLVDVEDPSSAAVGGPLDGEVLYRLVDVVGGDPSTQPPSSGCWPSRPSGPSATSSPT